MSSRQTRTVLVPIKDVQPGDYVLSLNEDTGQIEPHRINALLDMGVKPVFKLTTEDGRTIRTTGNHPYLTTEGWRKVMELSAGEEIAVPREISVRVSYERGDGQDISTSVQAQERPKPQLSLPYLVTSLIRMDKNTKRSEYEKQNSQNYSQPIRKISEEVAGQTNNENTLSQISQEFCDKLFAIFTQWFHGLNVSHLVHVSSEILARPAYADVAYPLPEHLTEQYEFSDMRAMK